MSYLERLTVNGVNIDFQRKISPVDIESVKLQSGEELKLEKVNIFDPKLVPSNYDKPGGTPMTIYQADGPNGFELKVDLSKRTKEAMSFWHRSADFDELIFCVKGQIVWETELGMMTLNEGEMYVIPRGIAHRSMPGQSETENVVVELKVRPVLRKVLDI